MPTGQGQGHQPRVCVCGHVLGDHVTAGSRSLHAKHIAGRCLDRGCDCEVFSERVKRENPMPVSPPPGFAIYENEKRNR